MATFPFTSDERHPGKRGAAGSVLLLAVLLFAAAPLRAGTVITLTNGGEIDGKLSVVGGNIHVEAESSPGDTPVSDVLESRFDDQPFSLHEFRAGSLKQLPPNWVSQDIGEISTHGSVTIQDGNFTLTSNSSATNGPAAHKDHDRNDNFYFVGVPWPDNGQFTVRLASLDPPANELNGGISFRQSLDPASPMCTVLVTGQGEVLVPSREEHRRDRGASRSTITLPLWLRLTRYGDTVYPAVSSDGTTWDTLSENVYKDLTGAVFGLTAHSLTDKTIGKAVFDHISITPLPSNAQTLSPGVILQGGSLLAGKIAHLNLDASSGADNGEIVRGESRIMVSRSLIAAVAMLPIDRSQLAQYGSQPGLLMRNGDTMQGDITAIGEEISVSSVLLGINNYKTIEVRACFLQPLQIKPAPLEVRLRDGSILNATAINGDANEVVITDVSGLQIQAGADEVAQIRAGTSVVQNLAQLDWKATGPGGAAAPAPAPAPANPAPANNGVPGANPAPEPVPPLVQSWLGNDQEQILEAGVDTAIDFPLPGKFRALGVQIAITSDSPANATADIRILSDGHELAKSPPFRAGDPPRFLELTLPTASHITLQAESIFPGTKVLYIDPVAIR